MKKIFTAISVFTLCATLVKAQVSDEDVLRFSQLNFGGTARSMGSAGAFGALGADFSSLSNNPAGLAMYKRGEFTFTPTFAGIKSTTNFIGNSSTDHKYNFNFSNLGFVWCVPPEKSESKWKGWNFGIGYNRLSSYQNRIYLHGFNNDNSLLDRFLEEANSGNGINPNTIGTDMPFTAGLAYNSYLINPIVGDTNHYESVISVGAVEQSDAITYKGATNEWVFSLAGNYNDKLYLGATGGIPSVYYHQHRNHTETDSLNLYNGFQQFSFHENIDESGAGMNGKFGLIYRVNDYFRIGIAAHTPTFYWMSSRYNTSIDANLDTMNASWSSPNGHFNYNMVTPWRLIGSAAVLFGKYGFISADYEWVDYSSGSVDFTYGATSNEIAAANNINQLVQNKYTAASNLRLGGEFSYDVFRLRAGYAMYASPFATGQATGNSDYSRNFITGGIGFRENDFSLDMSMVHQTGNEFYQPYTLSSQIVPGSTIKKQSNTFSITLGMRF